MDIQARVQACLERAVANHECAGMTVLVRKNGQDALYAGAGYADVASGKKVQRDHIFRLYSQSKPVTAAAAMILVERGLLDLMDPVENFLPGFQGQQVYTPEGLKPATRPVWVMDLLGMTAGVAYPDADEVGRQTAKLFMENHEKILAGGGMSTVEFCDRMGQIPLAFQPGAHWRYSTCADILGAVIEVVSGKPFDEFLREELFIPLGMKDTGFWVPEDKRDRFVTCYKRVPGGVEPFGSLHLAVGDYTRRPAFCSGGAGLVSTLDDYAAFADMLMNEGEYQGKRILRPETVRYMTKSQLSDSVRAEMWDSLTGYGYGKLMRVCVEEGRWAGLTRLGEYGWDGWLGSYFANLPSEKLTILSMQNTTDTGTSSAMRKVRNVLLAAESAGEI
ncbi:MAG: beta-lactamase family protein [Clostridiales bacterium]|nr:beta-lactamase family protein [Clostridiales bacterium]